MELERLASFYGNGRDELHLAFNFTFLHADLDADVLSECVERRRRRSPTAPGRSGRRRTTTWSGSRRAGPTATRGARVALLMLLTLRGTPVLYYGDELLLPNVEVPEEALRDPVAVTVGPEHGRDGERTPMPWEPGPAYGFTTGEPWLPTGDRDGLTVAEQRADPARPCTSPAT